MKKYGLAKLDFVFGSVLLLAACSKAIDPLLLHKLIASSIVSVGFICDIFLGCLLIANRESRKVRQIAFGAFAVYAMFLMFSISQGVWSCNCFGGTKSLTIPLAFDVIACLYFACLLWTTSASDRPNQERIDRPIFLTMVFVFVVGTVFMQVSSSDPIKLAETEVVESGSHWYRSELTVQNKSRGNLKLTGLESSCSFIPVTRFPLSLNRGETTQLDVLIRNPGVQILNFVDGEVKLFYEVSDRTFSQDFRWGLKL